MNSTGETMKFSGSSGGRFLLCSLLLVSAFVSLPAAAAINQTINYQGFLLSKATNLPVETPQAVKFIIYNAPAGGSALFTDSRCGLGVVKGRYDVEIGSLAAGGIPDTVFQNNQGLWLEIQVDPDANCSGSYEAMSPRIRLQSSPYAFNALYASTAAAGTAVFSADTIGALPQTVNGAITISTNLFVMGGISVGAISPGQTLAVAGIVQSSTGGFKFPDGSIQITAAAETMWKANGPNIYTINPGNIGLGEELSSPLARLHISSAAGDTGDLLLVSTGALGNISRLFWVNGNAQVHGGSYYGDGTTLTGLVRQAGDTMTGPLTLAGSSLTVTSPAGLTSAKIKLDGDGVYLSSASAGFQGGIYVSTHVWLSAGARFIGDGSGLFNVVSTDTSKVLKTGDTMTGPLSVSTLTVRGDAFSVAGSTFSIFGGSVAIGGFTYPARLSVAGGIIATSSITANLGLYSSSLHADVLYSTSIIASSATFLGYDVLTSSYNIITAGGIKVSSGEIDAPYFAGDGSLLTHVTGTDQTRVLKAGDTMTGNLHVMGSSLTITTSGSNIYGFTVASSSISPVSYALAVTTGGNVGINVSAPAAPLEVKAKALISAGDDGYAGLNIYSNGNPDYISWKDYTLHNSGGEPQGALGFFVRDFIYRVMGTDPVTGGAEVFRIASALNQDGLTYNPSNWMFGIGTTGLGFPSDEPLERFHVATNMLVSTAAVNPILFVSTATGRVSIRTNVQTHALTVNGGIYASSITAQAGFFGDGSGIINLSTNAIPQEIKVATITAIPGSAYDAVVFTTNVYMNHCLAVGGIFAPAAELNVRGTAQVNASLGGAAVFNFYSYDNQSGAPGYIHWGDGTFPNKGALGVGADDDLVYTAGGSTLSDGNQAFRIKPDGKFIVGGATSLFVPTAPFQILTNMLAGTSNAPGLYVSNASGYVGVSTGAPREGLHVASSLLVGSSRYSPALYVSTGTGNIFSGGTHTGAQTLPASGAGTRFMWIPSLGAIRAGDVSGTQWDGIGDYSVAFGQNNISSGTYSGALSGLNNVSYGVGAVISGGSDNYVSGDRSVVPGGRWNVVMSSNAFAGGLNNYLDTDSSGTFVWAYDDAAANHGILNPEHHITASYSFLIDPNDIKHYDVGIRTPNPQAALDVNGNAQFGSGVNKSTFTAEGLWVPRSMTTVQMQAISSPPTGAVIYNSDQVNICFYNGTKWVTAGNKADCS